MNRRNKLVQSFLIPDKIELKPQLIRRNREEHYTLTKEIKAPRSPAIINIHASNTRVSQFVKETLLQLKSHTDYHTPIRRDFNTQFSPMYRPKTKQRDAGNKCHYTPNGPNRYVQKVSPKHRRAYLLISSSWNFFQN